MKSQKCLRRKVAVVGLIVISFLFFECSSSNEEETPKTTTSKLVGTWKAIKYVQECVSGFEVVGNDTPCDQKRRWQFNANGTYVDTFYGIGSDNICDQEGIHAGTWKIENEQLITTKNGIEIPFTYFELTANTLKIGQYDDQLPCGTNDVSVGAYFEFKRIEG